MSEYQTMMTAFKNANEEKQHALSVATSSGGFTGPILSGFHEIHPEIRITETPFTKKEWPGILYDPEIHCVLAAQDYEGEQIAKRLIFRRALYLIVPADHELTKYDELSIKEARDVPLVLSLKTHSFAIR